MGRVKPQRPPSAFEKAYASLGPRVYVYPDAIEELAQLQSTGAALYGSSVLPPSHSDRFESQLRQQLNMNNRSQHRLIPTALAVRQFAMEAADTGSSSYKVRKHHGGLNSPSPYNAGSAALPPRSPSALKCTPNMPGGGSTNQTSPKRSPVAGTFNGETLGSDQTPPPKRSHHKVKPSSSGKERDAGGDGSTPKRKKRAGRKDPSDPSFVKFKNSNANTDEQLCAVLLDVDASKPIDWKHLSQAHFNGVRPYTIMQRFYHLVHKKVPMAIEVANKREEAAKALPEAKPSLDVSDQGPPLDDTWRTMNTPFAASGPTTIDPAILDTLDVGMIQAAYHGLYTRSLFDIERRCIAAEKKSRIDEEMEVEQWEDICLICKDGGELILCEYGHDDNSTNLPKCFKAYHMECLGMQDEPKDGWCCPRHKCVSCKQPNSAVVAVCLTCHLAYCNDHVPADAYTLKPGEAPQGAGYCRSDVRLLTCASCLELPNMLPFEEATGVDPAKVSYTSAFTKHANVPESKWPEWMAMINTIRGRPPNNGRPIYSGILDGIRACGDKSFIQGALGRSVSASVYQDNSAGRTKRYALQVMERVVTKMIDQGT